MTLRLGIRTHFYDGSVDFVYNEWRKLLGDDVFLLVDETRGNVDVAGAPKISWTESDSRALGLPLTPVKKVPWHNGDYHMYHVRPHLREDDFCFLVEHDVFLKVADPNRLLTLLKTCAEYDFVAPRIGRRPPHWKWRKGLDLLYEDVRGALVMMMGFNRRAADYLFERRLALQHKCTNSATHEWPNVEAFVGSELFLAESLNIADMEILGGMTRKQIRTSPPFLMQDLMENAPADVIYHPCLPRDRFLRKLRPLFRFGQPSIGMWDALWPFVSTASEDEMKQLDRLSQQFWNTPSYMAAFSEAVS